MEKNNMFAFPCPGGSALGYGPEFGMTLRQWYAGLAMQGLLASTQAHIENAGSEIAGYAFDIADAMIAAEAA